MGIIPFNSGVIPAHLRDTCTILHVFLPSPPLSVCQYIDIFWGGINFGANTCGACIRTRAYTGKFPGELFMYWLRAKEYFSAQARLYMGIIPFNSGVIPAHLRDTCTILHVFSPSPPLSVWTQWLYSHTTDANT